MNKKEAARKRRLVLAQAANVVRENNILKAAAAAKTKKRKRKCGCGRK